MKTEMVKNAISVFNWLDSLIYNVFFKIKTPFPFLFFFINVKVGVRMYYGDSFADLATMRLEGKIKKIYAQAYREIEEKLDTFLAKSVIKEKEYEAKVQAGKLSQEWFDRWKSGQVFIGKRWRDLQQNIANEIYNSRKSATDMINDERKAVFQDNVNYAQYTIDKDHSFGISFTLYDNATVTRLIKEDPDLVPDIKYPDPSIDYAWSKKQITSAITQGILQGESIPELAKRVGKKLQSSNTASMVRCARTAMTGAQNSGRIQAMHNAQGMGIDVEKLWIATLDGRTRDSHRDLDGQLAKVDEPFHSLLGDIMFPGDPNAAPANVWQCRCSLGWNYPKYSNQYDTRAAREVDWEDGGQTEQIPYMTYKEWAKWKQTGQLPQRGLSVIFDHKPQPQQPQEIKTDKITELKKTLASGNESLYDVGKRLAEIMHEKFAEFKSSNSVTDLKTKLEEAEFDIDYINIKNAKSLLEDTLFWNVLSKDFGSIEESVLLSIRDGLKVLKWNDKKIKTEFDDKIKNGTFTTNDFKSISQKIDKVLKEKEAFINDLRYKVEKSTLLRGRNSAQILKETLSNFREVGADGFDLKLHLQYSKSPMRPVVEEAYTYYPKAWVESSIKRGSLGVKKTDRGYYNGIEIAISGYGDSSFGTAIHELGHRFEDAVKGIKQEESDFYSKRTAGEKLEWLGKGYDRGELTRKDNFLDPYMGKDYQGYAYELVSMGFQYAYTDPEKLAKDPDMESWIYGLLLTK